MSDNESTDGISDELFPQFREEFLKIHHKELQLNSANEEDVEDLIYSFYFLGHALVEKALKLPPK